MPIIAYKKPRFRKPALATIEQANRIIADYLRQGYKLTLRQLYYQFVARDLIANKQSEYKNLGNVINDARLCGLIDWDAIEDRTRNLHSLGHWANPADIIDSAAYGYKNDLWKDQPHRVEVWIEKEALAGVFMRICDELRVPFFACRGYTSQSEMWAAGQRLLHYARRGQSPIILHFGDHDPSGMDMTRDIVDRLEMFTRGEVSVNRLALNWDQIQQYEPPPNPAKQTDSRFQAYYEEYGDESWELDALEPTVLAGLVRTAVLRHRDEDLWEAAERREERGRRSLAKAAKHWSSVESHVATLEG